MTAMDILSIHLGQESYKPTALNICLTICEAGNYTTNSKFAFIFI